MIKKYIVELLKENSRVIVPDLGAFMAKLKADAPKESKEVKDKNISFNDFLKYNDGLLVNHIIKEEKINKDEALKKIKEFVNESDKALRKGENITIESIGSLFMDDKNSIKFSTEGSGEKVVNEEKKVETPKKETKKEVKKKVEEKKPVVKKEDSKKEKKEVKTEVKKEEIKIEVKKEEPKKVEKKVEVKKEEKKPEEKKVEEAGMGKEVLKSIQKTEAPKKEEVKKEEPVKEDVKTPVIKEAIKKDETKPYQVPKDNTNQIILWTSISVVAVIAIVLVIMNFSTIKSWFIPEKPFVVEKVEKKPPVQKAKPKAEPVKKAPVKKTPPPTPKEYHVIAGSFKVESNATNFVKKMKAEGYQSELVGVRNGFHFVSFSSHETKAQAYSEFNKIRQQGKESWVLRMKKQ
jgi:nucleoid DNA-binding protein